MEEGKTKRIWIGEASRILGKATITLRRMDIRGELTAKRSASGYRLYAMKDLTDYQKRCERE
jgi:hypothetical protein